MQISDVGVCEGAFCLGTPSNRHEHPGSPESGTPGWPSRGRASLFVAASRGASLRARGSCSGAVLAATWRAAARVSPLNGSEYHGAGLLSDRMNRIPLLMIGFALLICADLCLALSNGVAALVLGVVLWGLHMGVTQGLLATLIADTAPAELRGTAYGMFNLLGGIALLAASTIAGRLWDLWGPEVTFLTGAGFTAIALAGLFQVRHRIPERVPT